MELKEQKKKLRKKMRMIRDSIPMKEEKSKKIVTRFMELPEVKDAVFIYCYISFRSEVDTMPLLHSLWKSGKRVAVPRVDCKEMQFYEIFSMNDLEIGYYGIQEPKKDCNLAHKADLIVLPGLAFDKKGHRLGYGGGFYDRYLEEAKDEKKIALAFSEQLVEEVPIEERDVIVDKIITEKMEIRI